MDRWRDVVGYEGLYQVSNLGRVRSVDRIVPHNYHGKGKGDRLVQGKILRPYSNTTDIRLAVTLSKQGKRKTSRIHRLVARAWIGLCPEDQEIRHGIGGPLDNSVSNLCYGTRSQNSLDKRRDGVGIHVRRSDGVEFVNMSIAADESACYASNIRKVCKGQRKTTGGFGWEYI